MKTLYLYSTREGQTEKIIHKIASELDSTNADFIDLHTDPQIELGQYEKILVGASIRYGHLNKKLYQFIDRHADLLTQKNAAFFCVNLTARKVEQGKDTPEGSAYIRTFLKKSKWQPSLIGVFAGALLYPRYSWFDKKMIQLIMKMTGGETDTSKEVEYTNWKKVSQFAQKFKN